MKERESRSERIILNIPVDFTAERLAELCRIRPDSAAFAEVEEALPLVNRWGAPKAVIRWANVDKIEGDFTTIEGITFESKVVAAKLKDMPRVFLSVATAGDGLENCSELEDHPLRSIFDGALIHHAVMYVIQYMQDTFGFDGSSTLNPGSLPDWPIRNNFALVEIIGGTEDIGVTLNSAGYMKPWNSTSQIHFPGDGYKNCSLCKNYDCVGRRAKFDRETYIRIFGSVEK